MIVDELKEEFVKELLSKGKRADERGLLDYRAVSIDAQGVLPNAEGGAMASIGDTKVLAGVKFDVMEPYRDKPDEGVLSFSAEFSNLAHPDFYSGPPGENAIELARVVDRGIRSAESVDAKSLFLEEKKAFGIFVDLYVLDHCGNLIDTAALAAMAALMNTNVPKYEDGRIIRSEFTGKLNLSRTVTTCSFEKINGKLLLDATEEEEVASDGRLTLATSSDGFICAGQKSGAAGFTKEEMMQMVGISLEKGNWLTKYLE